MKSCTMTLTPPCAGDVAAWRRAQRRLVKKPYGASNAAGENITSLRETVPPTRWNLQHSCERARLAGPLPSWVLRVSKPHASNAPASLKRSIEMACGPWRRSAGRLPGHCCHRPPEVNASASERRRRRRPIITEKSRGAIAHRLWHEWAYAAFFREHA